MPPAGAYDLARVWRRGRLGPGHALPVVAATSLIAALLLVLAFVGAGLAYNFPPLTGRVVDQANVIPEAVAETLTQKLAALEAKSGIQLVVATVTSLEGDEIEPYANALFRAWGLGEKDKNNGVLVLVAPQQHKVRIEVGYGLEGTLTDALSKIIITNAMTPRFKTGDYGGGLERGVDDIITVLTTDSAEWGKRPDLRIVNDQESTTDGIAPLIAIGLFLLLIFMLLPRGIRGDVFSFLLGMLMSSGGSSGGGSSGGGWSGGGGSSGGGGASGSW
ncbi:hypothetical protein CU048_09285 [Beijerinckiaceae bacterium]|nr:hypothetical protein CU048_09285 [Beijerinckiaceae bacterium]